MLAPLCFRFPSGDIAGKWWSGRPVSCLVPALAAIFPWVAAGAFLCGCTSTSYRIAYDKGGRPVPVLGLQSDVIGEASIRVTAQGDVVIDVKNPELPPTFPVATVEEFGRDGTLLRRTQTPLVAGIYHARVNDSIWIGAAKLTRSLGNLAGTVISGIVGIFTAQSLAAINSQPSTISP